MKRAVFLLFLPLFLCFSCLHSRTTAPAAAVSKVVIIELGNAILKINGQINENLYSFVSSDYMAKNTDYYDNPVIKEGSISKNETKYLSTGEKYSFSVLPTEVVTINITSLDGNDVEISVLEFGKEKKYHLEGSNKMGLFIGFQNR